MHNASNLELATILRRMAADLVTAAQFAQTGQHPDEIENRLARVHAELHDLRVTEGADR